jgi:DNA polymerase-3 subunit delta'
MTLRTPPAAAVADVLVRRDGVDPETAQTAAQAAQGHIGRARRLATDARARERRAAVLQIPMRVGDLGAGLKAAAALVEAAEAEARESTAEVDAGETEELRKAFGEGATGKGVRGMARGAEGALKDLERRQKTRAKRMQRDALDRALVDLTSFYRDVLAVQVGSGVPLTNDELRSAVVQMAGRTTPEQSLRRIEAILACREAIEANVAPLLAVEAMTLALGPD